MPQVVRDSQKLNTELVDLKREVRSLRSLVISLVGEDKEGRYRPEFVREILRAARQQPERLFKDARTFLAELRSA